jgi:hypothetical protein
MKELTDFLDRYDIDYTIDNGYVVANEIDLSFKNISELPDNFHLIKCNNFYLGGNEISELPENFHLIRCNSISLYNNRISKLPENIHLLKCNNLNLGINKICELPENFHLIECDTIDLSHNKLNKLPENFHLIKCNYLYLNNNKITELSDNFHLIKCTNLYLSDNEITELPDNFHLIKCNSIDLSFNNTIKLPENINLIKCNVLLFIYYKLYCNHQYFDEVEITKEYIYCDGLLTWYDTKKQINDYTVYFGRFGEIIVTKDNLTFAHGNTIRQAISDLLFKLSDRNKDEYLELNKNVQYPIENMIVMYRTITGACSFGVEEFMKSKNFNDTISLNEINAIIGNNYGSKSFREFFNFS